LPGAFNGNVVGGSTIFLQDAGFTGRDAGSAVVSDPPVAPSVGLSPTAGVEVEGAEIEILWSSTND